VSLLGWGQWRLAEHDVTMVPDVRLRLVQPAITQDMKADMAQAMAMLNIQAHLSQQPGDPTHIVWAEAAWPYVYYGKLPELEPAARMLKPGQSIIMGLVRAERPGGKFTVWNSILAVDAQGQVPSVYDKLHLVPFGEYVPLRAILPIDKVVPGAVDFSTGKGREPMMVPGLPPFLPLICYEAIFPDYSRGEGQWLLNISNDGWFGTSTGPYQHFEMARARAVEQGLPLVRVANTGISGVVDGVGRVLERTRLGEQIVLDVSLPQALKMPTLYAKWGDWPALVIGGLIIIGAVAFRRQKLK